MRNQGLPLQGRFPQQTSVSPPLLLPPDSPHRINCSCILQVFDATARSRGYILRVAMFYLIHPYPSRIFFFLRCILLFHFKQSKPVSMCESHSRPPGLCLFTTSPFHEWFTKSCITIMTHCLSLFLEDRLSGVDKWLEFQNNTNISKETFFFTLWIMSSAG